MGKPLPIIVNNEKYITLREWTLIYGLPYDGYVKRFKDGKLPQALLKEGTSRIFIKESFIPPSQIKIKCAKCAALMYTITQQHLNICSPGLILENYTKNYESIAQTIDHGFNGYYPPSYVKKSQAGYVSLYGWCIKNNKNFENMKREILNQKIRGFYDHDRNAYWINIDV